MREVFQCPNYSHNHKNDSLFQRSTGEPINHFSFDDVQQGLLMGACSTCNDDALVVSGGDGEWRRVGKGSLKVCIAGNEGFGGGGGGGGGVP